MLLSGIEIVPLVENTGQANMCFADNLLRLFTCPMQDAPVGLVRLIELVVCFLNIAQANRRQYCREDSLGCLAESYGLSKCPAGGGTISLQGVRIPQSPVGTCPGRQVVGMQILQGTA